MGRRLSSQRLALWALVLLAFTLRLWVSQYARFLGDEGLFWATARKLAMLEEFPTYGPSMTGTGAMHPGPFFFYLMALPQRIGPHPIWGAGFIAFLHALAIYGIAKLLALATSSRTALLGAAILACAPWEIVYADRIWLGCMMPVWGTAILYSAANVHRARWQGMLAFLVVTSPEIHMSAPIVWLAACVVIAFAPRFRLSLGAITLGVLLGAVTYTPSIVNELKTSFSNVHAILSEGGGHEGKEKVRQIPFRVALYALLFGTSEMRYQFAEGYFGWRPFDDKEVYFTVAGWEQLFKTHGLLKGFVHLTTIGLAGIGWAVSLGRLASALWRALLARRRLIELEHRITLGVVVGLAAAATLLTVAKKQFFPHYLILLSPMLMWPAITGLGQCYARYAKGLMQPVLLAVLGASLLAMVQTATRYYQLVDGKNGMAATWTMVGEVLEHPMPVSVTFDELSNASTWAAVAKTGYGRTLELYGAAPTARFRVRNSMTWDSAPTADSTLHGRVALEKTELRPPSQDTPRHAPLQQAPPGAPAVPPPSSPAPSAPSPPQAPSQSPPPAPPASPAGAALLRNAGSHAGSSPAVPASPSSPQTTPAVRAH